MNRSNQILATVLVLQVVLVGVVFWPRQAPAAGDEPLFPELAADQIVALRIADLEEGELRLVRQGEAWVLPEGGDYPVREGAVSDLLETLTGLQAGRVVAETRSSYERLQVADDAYNRLLTLELADGSQRQLYLGSTPSYNAAHVRLGGQEAVYLVSGLSSTDLAVAVTSWIDTTYIQLTADEVVALNVENENGTFELTRDQAGTWTMAGLEEGEELDQTAVGTLISRISTVRMLRPLGQEQLPEYGLDDPRAVVTAQTRDAEGNTATHVLTIGARDEGDGSYVAKYAASPYYVRLADYVAGEWVTKTHDGWLVPPPTPTLPAAPGP